MPKYNRNTCQFTRERLKLCDCILLKSGKLLRMYFSFLAKKKQIPLLSIEVTIAGKVYMWESSYFVFEMSIWWEATECNLCRNFLRDLSIVVTILGRGWMLESTIFSFTAIYFPNTDAIVSVLLWILQRVLRYTLLSSLVILQHVVFQQWTGFWR